MTQNGQTYQLYNIQNITNYKLQKIYIVQDKDFKPKENLF